ncbi:MAG: RagB/SusD family nutrient uptake outer membrane protein, partial [Chitinophagaceae bacterium]|nr:RagB/SusD family nutrient uptake outer membrane protein [Chitinophagaceae bacterium]
IKKFLMKTYRYLFLLAFVGVISCKKSDLELYPYNQIETENAFKTEADVTLAVNGMYAGLRSTSNSTYFVNGIWNILADVLSDNLIVNVSGPGRLTLRTYGNWQYTGEGTYQLFTDGYIIARRANAILENIDKMPDGAFKNNAKGEALAVRAMTYFDMARVYSKTYQNANATDWTVPYVTSTDPTILPPTEPVHGFYDKVIGDLESAKNLIGSDNGLYRMNKLTVSALLSRVYFYKGDFTKCIEASNDALGANPSLPARSDFGSIWKDAEANGNTAPYLGVYFKIRNTKTDNINNIGVNYYQPIANNSVPGGYEVKSEYVVPNDFRQLFAANDIRTTTYLYTGIQAGKQFHHVIKYGGRASSILGTDPSGTNPVGVVDYKVIRTAEVLLNRAEAYYRATPSNPAAALADLQALKKARYSGYLESDDAGLTGQLLLNEILLQRRLELAFEGDRFWDLKRRNQGIARSKTIGDLADGTGVPYIFTDLPAGDHRFQLPFPQREINFNTNIKQNPDY